MLDLTEDARSSRQDRIEAIRRRPEFAVFAGTPVDIGSPVFADPALLALELRWALECSWLLAQPGAIPARAEIAAARAAALFIMADTPLPAALPNWVVPMAAEVAPPAAALAALWPAATVADIASIRAVWSCLGTAEAIMETGGDIRLARDPVSALNGYGCSHRPRPWAITFASSTASSSSERGYAAADAARLRATAAMLVSGVQAPVRAALAEVQARLAQIFSLPEDGAVVLAASGTDTELLALALTHLAEPAAPILNILIAPEETGSGVPMAAKGLHFAVDTALGHDVARAAPIAGFRADTELANIPLRHGDGTVRPAAEVEDEIAATIEAGIAAGQRVLLHVLDLSKTGLQAPRLDCLRRLYKRFGAEKFDIVVDACQARLSRAAVRHYLALDAIVLITGSKFFTGPPFAGALLIPPGIAARLQSGLLPAGLAAYFHRDEFPETCPAAAGLQAGGNYGLALRWHAALAEIKAVMAIPSDQRAEILRGFAEVVAAKTAADPAFTLYPAPPIRRAETDESWERCQSIFTFAMAAPHAPGGNLDPGEARAVYRWLNADLSAVLPGLDAAARNVAARICHIGQPVPLRCPDGGSVGVLRVSAGARLLSGEPSHGSLDAQARIARELADLALVFDKISLILKHFSELQAADPAPVYKAAP
jgi:hypothetical protein